MCISIWVYLLIHHRDENEDSGAGLERISCTMERLYPVHSLAAHFLYECNFPRFGEDYVKSSNGRVDGIQTVYVPTLL